MKKIFFVICACVLLDSCQPKCTDDPDLTADELSWFNCYTNGQVFIYKSNTGLYGVSNPIYPLDVAGTIHSCEVKVDMNNCDFVFEEGYKIMPLNELSDYFKKNHHLPHVASAKEMVAKGVGLGELSSELLQSVEEQALYTIDLQKQINDLKKQVADLQKRLK